MRNLINRAAAAATFTVWNTKRQAKEALCNERGDFYISDGVKIIIAVVLGALLLANRGIIWLIVAPNTIRTVRR